MTSFGANRPIAALATAMLLAGCLTNGPEASSTSPLQQAAASATAAPLDPASRAASGTLDFVLSPSGSGNYQGWQVQVLSAARNKGFIPFTSGKMMAGASLRAELWPDRYRVRVLLLGDVELDRWVVVAADRASVVHVEIGFLTNDIAVREAVAAAPIVGRTRDISQTYEPLSMVLRPGLRGEYAGPQVNGAPAGSGRLRLFQRDREVAVIEEASVRDGRFVGRPVFADGRQVDGALDDGYAFPEGTETRWPDGRVFIGRYDGLAPALGSLRLADGVTIKGVRGADPAALDGGFECFSVLAEGGRCHFFEGTKVASADAYAERADTRRLARAAAQAAAEAGEGRAVGAPAAAADGCARVAGRFTADGGLSRLTLDGAGRGSLWQKTYGGSEVYTFDVEFSYRAGRDSMTFDYGPAIYRDAGGSVLRRTTIPGGRAACAFDGRTLSIDGKPYLRQ